MRFSALQLVTTSLSSLRLFYTDTLGLSLVSESSGSFSVRAGTTDIRFTHDADATATLYHLAFTVDADSESVAAWVEAHTTLVPVDDNPSVRFSFIEADSVYFTDPAGNIVEFICPFGATGAFTPETIEHVSEVGLPVEDPPAVAEALSETFGVPVWGEVGETFVRLGDVDGRFVISALGRTWFPTNEDAVAAPLDVTVESTRRAAWCHPDLPYRVGTSSQSTD